jgi:hypothetical protein
VKSTTKAGVGNNSFEGSQALPASPSDKVKFEFRVNREILATCSSTYSPVCTSQEAHSVSIK